MFNFDLRLIFLIFLMIATSFKCVGDDSIKGNNDYTFNLNINTFDTLSSDLDKIKEYISDFKDNKFILKNFAENEIILIKVIFKDNSFYLVYTIKDLTLQGFINYNNDYYYFSNSIINNIPTAESNNNLNLTIKNLPTKVSISFPKIINTFFNLSQYSGTTNILNDLSFIIYISSMTLKSKLVLKTLEDLYNPQITEAEYTAKITIYDYLINNKKWIQLSNDSLNGLEDDVLNILKLN